MTGYPYQSMLHKLMVLLAFLTLNVALGWMYANVVRRIGQVSRAFSTIRLKTRASYQEVSVQGTCPFCCIT